MAEPFDEDDLPGWEDFEPKDRRAALAWALMVAGVVDEDWPGPGVKLDYDTAERVIDALEHLPSGSAALTFEPTDWPDA